MATIEGLFEGLFRILEGLFRIEAGPLERPLTATQILGPNPGSLFYFGSEVFGPTAKPPKSGVILLGLTPQAGLPQSFKVASGRQVLVCRLYRQLV